MKLAAALIISAATLALPATALGAPELGAPLSNARAAQTSGLPLPQQPLNVASDRVALNAYAAYLNAVVKGFPTAQTYATSYVSTIAGQCRSALEPLTQPNEQVDATVQQVLMALGEEMGSDLSIEFDQSAILAFERFSATISRLRWTRLAGGGAIVRRFINTETVVLGIAPSNLCQDALIAAYSPHVVPQGTKAFNKSYTRASRAANTALANLLKLMQTYETPSEKSTITRIANLAGEMAKLTQTDLMSFSSSLQKTLETS